MNKVLLCGRLTRDPDVRYSQSSQPICVARYTLAVDRRMQKRDDNSQTADFISCVAFGRAGEFAEKYLRQGMKMLVAGRIQTGSYTDRDGHKVYTTDVVIEEQEFAESKNSQASGSGAAVSTPTRSGSGTGSVEREYGHAAPDFAGSYNPAAADEDGFMPIPDSVDDEGLPFT